MDGRALVEIAECTVLSNGEIIQVRNAQDISFVTTQTTDFKLQGSVDGVEGYNDIEDSGFTGGDGSNGQQFKMSVYRCERFTHLKVVLTGAQARAVAIRRMLRQDPAPTSSDYIKHIIDPVAGTA